jgi:NAD(P) transhydrogenase
VSLRVNAVISRETEVIRAQLKRNGIVIFQGRALFLDPHTVEIVSEDGGARLKSDKILIACGTRPAHSPEIPYDDLRIVDADHLSDLDGLPSLLAPEWWAWSTPRLCRPWALKSP